MARKKLTAYLELKKNGEEYSLSEVRSEYSTYRGRIFALRNSDSLEYALIHDEQIPALSGPSGHVTHLLGVGEYPLRGRDGFLQIFLERAAKKQAKDLSEKLNLPLKVKK
jgi:hypothetical protein